ncbi:exosortase F system-associated protein [Aestuariibaculum sp. YM273]|uniref:exosortase F system-associated membrane protein n=1 Tax=Aestuariibaculum sp. YM273 TaxID=3070659 RepID=UPI0027DDE343|nr:exosortase F system-associated protein [Aestuariibaculum sp. YM273]WMI64061.1 exosortase F system-associated protein [Aestuariibaculum sp. YM273]
MSKILNYILVVVLFGLLILIRAFESDLFYDPYLTFFKNDYLYIDSPRRELAKLVFYTSLRFWLNTLVSLGILYLFFKDWSVVKFSVLFYAVAYIVLILMFLYFVINPRQEDYYLFFNFRRFLIQPVLLLLLLPAFYYYKLNR